MPKCKHCKCEVPGRRLCADCKEKSIKKNALSRVKSTKRKGYLYNEWARKVKERDKYICQHCGLAEKDNLQSHHIVPWEDDKSLRFEISNGMTLCRSCHTKEDRRIKPIKAWNKGKKLSIEHRAALSKAHQGGTPWNKGLKGVQQSTRKGLPGKKHTEDTKKKIGSFSKGRRWRVNAQTGKREWYDSSGD